MDDALQYAINHGIIDLAHIQDFYEMNKRKEYLDRHNFSIWQSNDGSWYTYLPGPKGRIQRKRSTKADIEDLIVNYWKEQDENPTVDMIFEDWISRENDLEKISLSTQNRYRQDYNRFYDEFGKRRIKLTDEEDWQDFLEEQVPRFHLTAKGFSNLKTITKGILKRAKKCKYINFNIEEMLFDIDVSKRDFKKVIHEDREEVFDDDEISKIFKYAAASPDYQNLGILLMFVTGVRVGELVAIKTSDISKNEIKIRRTESRIPSDDGGYQYVVKDFPKTEAGVRSVIVPNDYLWILKKLLIRNPFGEYLFVDDAGKRITTNSIRRRLERICKKLNIVCKSPHKIRKTYGSILLDNNIDNRMITDLMGHTDISMTEGHYHYNRRNIEDKVRILGNIPELSQIVYN